MPCMADRCSPKAKITVTSETARHASTSLSDSPWFWAYLFATAALVAIETWGIESFLAEYLRATVCASLRQAGRISEAAALVDHVASERPHPRVVWLSNDAIDHPDLTKWIDELAARKAPVILCCGLPPKPPYPPATR